MKRTMTILFFLGSMFALGCNSGTIATTQDGGIISDNGMTHQGNSYYSAVTGENVSSYMSTSPFHEPSSFNGSSKTLEGGSTSDIEEAINSLNGTGGTLTLKGNFNGDSAVRVNSVSNVRIIGSNATITVNGGSGFSDNYSGFVIRNSTGISIEGLKINASSGHGILVFGGCHHIRIKNNQIEASIRSSIIFYSENSYTSHFEISGNICKNFGNEAAVGGNSHHGIVTRYVKKGLIIGNLVDGTVNIGMSRMGLDISTNSWFVESCHNKVEGTNYGAKIGYAETQYIYFHDNTINSMNDEHHSDKAFYIHRSLGGPIFVENNIFWDDYLSSGDYDLGGAGCSGGIVYMVGNKDKNGGGAKANACSQDIEDKAPADVMNEFKNIGD